MNNKLFLIIKTNLYVGNFDRELMAYVFGFDNDDYAEDELRLFNKEMGENKDIFDNYLDRFAFGEHDGEYSCYKTESHPTNQKYNCDSFYICLEKKFQKNVSEIVANRLNNYCNYYNKVHNEKLKILDVNYYQNKFTKIDDNDLTL